MLVFEKRTLAFIKKHMLLERGDIVLAAVSGGPDSMALLDFLVKRKEQYEIEVVVAHVDHLLRGEQSVQDMEYVQTYCESNHIPFHTTSIDIKEKMEMDQTGLQETARTYRYHYFAQVMKEIGANKLAVGQHGDDQIETILMRLTRGSRGKARAGIQPMRKFTVGQIIRPLLSVTKEQIEQYCSTYHLQPRLDPSNEHPLYMRNRFRLELLPFLKKENKKVHEHFQRFSEDLLEDEHYLVQLTKQQITKCCEFKKGKIRLEIAPFIRMPLPLQRRGIHLILSYLYKQKMDNVNVRHFQLIDQLLKGEHPSGKLNLPQGLQVIRSYDSCLFTFDKQKQMSSYEYELHENDEVLLENGSRFHLKQGTEEVFERNKQTLILQLNDDQLPLIVRTRKPGDRIKLVGMSGTKKVKDLFIDEKINVNDRSAWPIITDQSGEILWIPGLRMARNDRHVNGRSYVLQWMTLGGSKVNGK